MLAFGRVVTAMAAAVFIVKILDMTVLLSEPSNRGKMIALVYMGFSAANVFGIPLGTLVGAMFGWRIIFLLVIVLALAVGLALILLAPDKEAPDKESTSQTYIQSMKNVVFYIGVTMSVLIGNYIVLGYISPLMTSNGYTLANVSAALFIAGAGGMAGTMLGGNMVDRFGPKRTILVMLSLFSVTMLIMPLLYGTPVLFYLNLFVWSLFQWSTSPAVQSGLVDSVEGSAANVFSWNMSGLNLGIGIGAVIGGIFISSFDISYAPWLSFFIILIGIVFALVVTDV